MDITPHLTFPGNCEEAMAFYAEVFGGHVEFIQKTKDSPMAGKMGEGNEEKVLHARLRLGERTLMASDAMGLPYEPPRGIMVQTSFEDPEKARRVFHRLAKHGETVMEFAPTFWSAGFGMCRDRFGIPWMVNCDAPPQDRRP